ncbi:hypothetical protein GH714_003257 [Hevea brasiliensis]|uniref:RING-type E3 ubiquitin transferase n=1 Tax=Hevea brasiliensis TaxID=3981 RepID=A0A6A6LYW3_HEVBR|nr:hypothetical protein GH714_003257 [Hevea brasiliensis]
MCPLWSINAHIRSPAEKVVSEAIIPSDFRCPISLELMRDPVVLATGQTYDRESITLWIESGHNTCPKTGQTLAHSNLIPHLALKNLIGMWCREQKFPFDTAENNQKVNGAVRNKAAIEAAKMTVSFLVNKLSLSQSFEAANGVVYELRSLAKTNSDSRASMAEAGVIPLLVRYLGSDRNGWEVSGRRGGGDSEGSYECAAGGAVAILEVVVKRGGVVAIAAAYIAIRKLGMLLREGSDAARESAVATLVTICRKGGSEMVGELAAIAGIERIIWEMMSSGTMRSRRKAATLLRILRRWAAGLDGEFVDLHTTATATISSSSRVALAS